MAYTPCYPDRINWQNEPSEATAINNVNLNKMDSAINTIDGRVVAMSTRLDTNDTAITNLQGNVSDLQGDMTTAQGNITTLQDGKVDKVNGKGLSQVDNVTVTQHVAYGTVVSTIKTYGQDGTEVTSQVCNGIVVDSALSNSSTNPVQNKVVKSAIDEKSTVAISDTLETGTTLANITIDGTTTAIKGSDIEVDEELSPTSTNPVENKAIYDALNNLLPSKTVSGNPISISDASGFNAKALTVTMNPIQDLHGYEYPWAGGAGKNKIKIAITTQTISDVDITVYDDGTFDANGTASADISLVLVRKSNNPISIPEGTLTLSGCPSGGSSSGYGLSVWKTGAGSSFDTGSGVSFNYASTQDWAVSLVISSGTQCNHKIFKPMICLSTESEPTTFAPYENICPISGRTEASVTRTGKNQFDKSANDTSKGYVDNSYLWSNGTTRTSNAWYISEYIRIYSALSLSGLPTSDASNPSYGFYTEDKTFISGGAYNNRAKIENFTIPENAYYFRISVPKANVDIVQVETNTTATAYEPYVTPETHTKEFGQTVYSGEYDFASGNGKSKQEKIILDGTENWSADTGRNGVYYLFNTMASSAYADCVCDRFKTIKSNAEMQSLGIAFGIQNKAIYIPRLFDGAISGVTDVASWKTYLSNNNMEITYPLSTPTNISTSAEEITLLKGNNVLSTNADDMELKYSVSLDSLLTT